MFVLSSTPKEFIPTSQKDVENPLTFIVKPPTRNTMLQLQEIMLSTVSDNGEITLEHIPLAKIMQLYFDECVIGWKNVTDADGKEIEFSQEAFLQIADMDILNELYNFIKELADANPLS